MNGLLVVSLMKMKEQQQLILAFTKREEILKLLFMKTERMLTGKPVQ